MTDREHSLTALIGRVPVHVVDIAAAREAGDLDALRYAKAMRAWLDEAAGLMAGQITDLFTCPEVGRVESQGDRGRRPVGDPSAELVSDSIFPPGAA